MNYFIIGFYALLIGVSSLAAFYQKRTAFLLLFSLTLVSFVMGIVGGEAMLWSVTILAGLIAFSAGVSFSFREFLVILLPPDLAKAMRTAPLTAGFGLFVIFTYAISGIFAPIIAPYGEAEVISSAFAPADENMLLGADTILAFAMGATAGLYAAAVGGKLDQLLGRIVDVIMSIPSLIFSLLLLSIFGTNTVTLIIVIAIIYAPRVFRLARSVGGNVVVMDYIEAAKLRGEGTWYLIRKEILPNSTAPLIAEFGLEFCFVFLLVAGLSFLGLGIQPPTADWGSMVRENATLISFGEITPLIPAAAIALLTVAVNFVVDWMLYRSSGLKE
jgi:peptide/nickel transport system permease protein